MMIFIFSIMSEGPPLFVACETNNLPLLIEALKTNSVDCPSPHQAFTPLMVAANRASIDLVTYLLENGAAINAQSEGGYTALILAITSSKEMAAIYAMNESANGSDPSLLVIKKLLDAGADVNISTGGGNRALQEAALHGNVEIVKLLLSKGAEVNSANTWKETALMSGSLSNGSAEVIQLLLEAGADPLAKDVDGVSALDLAEKSGNTAVLNVLKGIAHKEIPL